MLHRMIAAGIAVVGASMLAVPLAQGFNGRAAPSLPLVDPGKPITKTPTGGGGHPRFDAFHNFRRHEGFAPGFPLGWDYAGTYWPSETQPIEGPSYIYPSQDFADRSRPQVFYQPGCRTDTQTVPSEAGGTRTITITRCY